METIRGGMSGAAVEDVQERLGRLGYAIAKDELATHTFGTSTMAAVRSFRADFSLPESAEIDTEAWSVLVDATYALGDRTLYLRLPNFHGQDVYLLQRALNTLGFSCGEPDGYYGVHTEAAVKQFQENVGLFADGIAFPDTFKALWRLAHVWNRTDDGPRLPHGFMGFARAASVLEDTNLAVTGDDPIARNVAGRVWNLASATSANSGLELVNSPEAAGNATAIIELASTPPPATFSLPNVSMEISDDLALRIRTAFETSRATPPHLRVQLPEETSAYDGSFTVNDAQLLAATLLDALCIAFAPEKSA